MERTQFGAGLLVVGLATVAAAAVEFGTKIPRVTGVGVAAGAVVALVGLASVLGYGFDAEKSNRVAGVLVVFGTVAAFGLLVTGLMHYIE
jgi:FtsH-binding integral membrane protein